MGQYYKPINTEKMEFLYSHNYNNGLKLMEHSWLGNSFVGAVMSLMIEGGKWFKAPIVWCGDYYDSDGEICYYSEVEDEVVGSVTSMSIPEQEKAILVNYTKREYVVLNKVPVSEGWADDMKVHALPLLTALGNGRGGGDYGNRKSVDIDKVGIWANDNLGVVFDIPYGFWELEVNFAELE